MTPKDHLLHEAQRIIRDHNRLSFLTDEMLIGYLCCLSREKTYDIGFLPIEEQIDIFKKCLNKSKRKMDKTIKKMWVNDLRKNPHLQGHIFLTQIKDGLELDNALGRLCKLAEKEGRVFSYIERAYGDVVYTSEMDNGKMISFGGLPKGVTYWAELSSDNPTINIKGYTATISGHNDGIGVPVCSFHEIAEAIQDQL